MLRYTLSARSFWLSRFETVTTENWWLAFDLVTRLKVKLVQCLVDVTFGDGEVSRLVRW